MIYRYRKWNGKLKKKHDFKHSGFIWGWTNSYWLFMSPFAPFSLYASTKNAIFVALTVDRDLHCPDIGAWDVIRSNAFIRSWLLFGDGCQFQMFPLRHKFMSACGGRKNETGRNALFKILANKWPLLTLTDFSLCTWMISNAYLALNYNSLIDTNKICWPDTNLKWFV